MGTVFEELDRLQRGMATEAKTIAVDVPKAEETKLKEESLPPQRTYRVLGKEGETFRITAHAYAVDTNGTLTFHVLARDKALTYMAPSWRHVFSVADTRWVSVGEEDPVTGLFVSLM